MPLHRRLPKRGFRNSAFALKLNEINLHRVQAAIDAGKLDAGAPVDAEALVKAGVLRRARDGVRLLGTGEIKAKVAFTVWGASKSAVAAVEKAGGSVTVLAPKREAGGKPGSCLYKCGGAPHKTVMGGGEGALKNVSGGRNGSSSPWSLQQNNSPPISTSRPSPRPRSSRSASGSPS